MTENVPRVLIVDDEVDICFVLTGLFKSKNVISAYANSLAEAAVLMKSEHPTIIILDNHLPDGLGVEFIDHVKQFYPRVKIIMITAHDSPTEKNLAFQKGADYFIGKPFSIAAVRQAIDNLILRA
ncbi:MAG: response regulator [Chitinophagaceae bacterium]|nr:response regulator [Chitinophagaceae bacterium]